MCEHNWIEGLHVKSPKADRNVSPIRECSKCGELQIFKSGDWVKTREGQAE